MDDDRSMLLYIGSSKTTLEVHFQGPITARKQRFWPRWQIVVILAVRKAGEGTFGPSPRHDTIDPTCGYLEFHPRVHSEAEPGTLTPTVRPQVERDIAEDEGCYRPAVIMNPNGMMIDGKDRDSFTSTWILQAGDIYNLRPGNPKRSQWRDCSYTIL